MTHLCAKIHLLTHLHAKNAFVDTFASRMNVLTHVACKSIFIGTPVRKSTFKGILSQKYTC